MYRYLGVKIYATKKPVKNALLCVKTVKGYYHIEEGEEPEAIVKVQVTISNPKKKKIRGVSIRFAGLRDDYSQGMLEEDMHHYVIRREREGLNSWYTAEIPFILPKKKELIAIRYKVRLKVFKYSGSWNIKLDEKYLRDEPLIRAGNPKIKRLASELKVDENIYESVWNAVRWVHQNIKYEKNYFRMGSLVTLNRRKGSCIEIADLTTAILRAMGIPSRVVIGYLLNAYHAWVEVLTDDGWIPVEPTSGFIGAIGVPWISILGENRTNEKLVKTDCKECKVSYDLVIP